MVVLIAFLFFHLFLYQYFIGAIYYNSNYLINLKGFLKFDGTIFIDPSASSIETLSRPPKMRIKYGCNLNMGMSSCQDLF
jgi:hypothetical protein